jgi:hypothetical protein
MKIHTKTALILFVTLILGILLGTLVSGPLLIRRNLPRHTRMGLMEHFVEHFEDVTKPDEAQRDTVLAILESYADRFADLNIQHHSEVEVLMDSLQMELSPVLTEEQLERMRDHLTPRPFGRKDPPQRQRRHRH